MCPTFEHQRASRSRNPFADHLRCLAEGGLARVAAEAPLPLALMDGRDSHRQHDSQGFHRAFRHGHLIALDGPAAAAVLLARPWVSLLYVTEGEVRLDRDGVVHACRAGGCVLVPEMPVRWQSTAFSVVCLMTSRSHLMNLLERIVGGPAVVAAERLRLDVPRGLSARTAEDEAALIDQLERTLLSIGELLTTHPDWVDLLALDEQACRIMALMACPAARRVGSLDVRRARADSVDHDAFQSLIDYIADHLDKPLNLTLLQGRIHYSRRALQYAFRQRLGCTATQWIRAQRLDRARALLTMAAEGETVSQIAQACGYRSMSLFSIEFQQRFHIKPSVLLRDALARRLGRPAPPPDARA